MSLGLRRRERNGNNGIPVLAAFSETRCSRFQSSRRPGKTISICVGKSKTTHAEVFTQTALSRAPGA